MPKTFGNVSIVKGKVATSEYVTTFTLKLGLEMKCESIKQ